jgi:AcrB/AcrD/AcrF family
LLAYAVLIGVAGVQFARAPTGFIPEQDQGYLITVVQLPPGSTLERTEAVVKKAVEIIMTTTGIEHVAPFAGLDATTFTVAPNAGTIFSGLPSLYSHEIKGVTASTVLNDLRKRLSVIQDAYVLTIPPPPVQGLGTAGGFKMMLQDRAGLGSDALARGRPDAGRRGKQRPELRRRVHAVRHARTVGLCRHRSREGRESRPDADGRLLHAAGLSGLADNFLKPGNLAGGFAHYRAAHAARIRMMKGEASLLPAITVPTCLRWPEHDPLFPYDWTDRLGESFSDLDLAIFPGVGHFPHREDPDRAAAEIAAFFQRVGWR